jgi:hypothetical protein
MLLVHLWYAHHHTSPPSLIFILCLVTSRIVNQQYKRRVMAVSALPFDGTTAMTDLHA